MSKSKKRVRCCVCFALICVILISILLIILLVKSNRCEYTQAAVAADSEICSDVGRNILQEGGSAVDGAIAALLCTSLVNPQSMGLGGGAIFTVFENPDHVKVINGRERVPKVFKRDLLNDCPQNTALLPGSQWIGVPGEIQAYKKAHDVYGKLPWKTLFKPAIKLAREGFPLPSVLEKYLFFFQKAMVNSSLCSVFCKDNKVLKKGDMLQYPELAKTMEIIADKGPDAFYEGKLAEDLIQDIKSAGGSLSLEDLRSMQAEVKDALPVQLGDYTMYIPPLPASGSLLTFILNVMKGYSLRPESMKGEEEIWTYHHIIETLKFANGLKKYVKDPAFSDGNDTSHLVSLDFADKVRAMIKDEPQPLQYYNVMPSADSMGTSHLSVIDKDGMAVSVTSTINQMFGSTVYSPRTGVILNNELADFCGRATKISAGEQPPSSMVPTVLYSKPQKTVLVVGGAGGSMIVSSVALAIMNHIWMGKDLKDAISAPVVFVDSSNGVNFEKTFDQAVKEKLKAMGHKEGKLQHFFNVVNAISKQGSCITAVSDARKEGKAAGY
ncbi:glutathione hydrolase 5 proenzyme [Lepisosteus oculatus]|uniref:glutathione hydrolase 5 proenzyme n=1 Tax=Lepisosteus oculatus TaxID=7918 RepID=UPI0035F528E8